MHPDQLYFPGMEPMEQPAKPKPPAPTLRAIVRDLEQRVFALEVDMTVEKTLKKEK